MSSTEIKTANAENSKNIITAEVNDTCQVRVYSKSRAKGEMKYKKQRETFTFKTTEAANTAINAMVEAGTKIRKVELISADGTTVNFKPQRVRLTPTREQKEAAKAERLAKREVAKANKTRLKEEARAIKASAKAAVKETKVEVVDAREVKTTTTATAKPKAVKVTPNVAEKALS
jgi:hypothetical protein